MALDLRLKRIGPLFGLDDQTWLSSKHGVDAAKTYTIDASKFVLNTHYPTGFLKSGILLGLITATGLVAPQSDSATDGSENVVGILLEPISVWDNPTITPNDLINQPVAVLEHGRVLKSRLPFPPSDAAVASVHGRIIFA